MPRTLITRSIVYIQDVLSWECGFGTSKCTGTACYKLESWGRHHVLDGAMYWMTPCTGRHHVLDGANLFTLCNLSALTSAGKMHVHSIVLIQLLWFTRYESRSQIYISWKGAFSFNCSNSIVLIHTIWKPLVSLNISWKGACSFNRSDSIVLIHTIQNSQLSAVVTEGLANSHLKHVPA